MAWILRAASSSSARNLAISASCSSAPLVSPSSLRRDTSRRANLPRRKAWILRAAASSSSCANCSSSCCSFMAAACARLLPVPSPLSNALISLRAKLPRRIAWIFRAAASSSFFASSSAAAAAAPPSSAAGAASAGGASTSFFFFFSFVGAIVSPFWMRATASSDLAPAQVVAASCNFWSHMLVLSASRPATIFPAETSTLSLSEKQTTSMALFRKSTLACLSLKLAASLSSVLKRP
mmetsp:Transcript_62920/g.141777  ORF Transcript_62920/g.141777 Transcript_62920/m.141777 type:complete len:237 (-) Transcript_62920:270-980(-)